jgi:enterochelin esterase-like enzyme
MLSFIALLALELTAVELAAPAPTSKAPIAGAWSAPIAVTGTVDGVTHTADVVVYTPKGYATDKKAPLVLALHGWNHTTALFMKEGGLERWADTFGTVVVIPELGKSVYETAFYKESKAKYVWGKIPGTRWVGEVVLPWARKTYAVRTDRAHTAVLGYSTGGRGAVLLAEAYPAEFGFVGSLSGTYDLGILGPKEGEYKIHQVIFGDRDTFESRWTLDNIIAKDRLSKLADLRLYIAHGDKDKSVNPNQVDALRTALARYEKARHLIVDYVIVPGAAHDWKFWTSQWGPIFEAFDATLRHSP